jgi:predicted DNA-binding antitoxin AbrB/MazE fold protein
MAAYLNVRARYSKGTLKLKKTLRLPDGAEVSLTVTPLEAEPARSKAKPRLKYPTRLLPAETLQDLVGIVSLGGDALADSEALYD